MGQSLVKNLIHLVYSTKHRKPWIPEDARERLFAYQAGIFREWESPALVIGGVEDHIHALFSLSKNDVGLTGLFRPFRATELNRYCTQGDAPQLPPLRSALGCYVKSPSGRENCTYRDETRNCVLQIRQLFTRCS
jgi:hypothetical protein